MNARTALPSSWKPALALDHARMDATHREFVEQLDALAALAAGAPTAAQSTLDALVAHTEAHFAQEEGWMDALGFERGTCHHAQHASVLQVLHEVQRRLRAEGDALDPELLGRLVPALAEWLDVHVPAMDGALAQVMRERGFDPGAGAAGMAATAATASTTGTAGTAGAPPMIGRCDSTPAEPPSPR